METKTKILLFSGVAILFIIILVIWYFMTPTVSTLPVSNVTPTQPNTTPTTTQTVLKCAGGGYCNLQPIRDSDRNIGTIICGKGANGSQQYKCTQMADERTSWEPVNGQCTTGMYGMC